MGKHCTRLPRESGNLHLETVGESMEEAVWCVVQREHGGNGQSVWGGEHMRSAWCLGEECGENTWGGMWGDCMGEGVNKGRLHDVGVSME